MVQEKSCGVILYRVEKSRMYLLLKYRQGHWDFIKGKVEPGEKEKDTAIRETREETSINKNELVFHDEFKEKISYVYKKNRKKIDKEVIFFLAQTTSKRIKLSHEHIDFIWLPFKDAEKILTFQNAKKLLKKADSISK
jgi:8-oxo-dGTP pyrophosphatase MutT (NUDIX family)